VPFLSDQNIGGQLSSLPCSISPKVTQSKFLDRHFVHSPCGRAASFDLCPLLTYCIGYCKVYFVFILCFEFSGRFFMVGGRGDYVGGSSRGGREFSMMRAPDFRAFLK